MIMLKWYWDVLYNVHARTTKLIMNKLVMKFCCRFFFLSNLQLHCNIDNVHKWYACNINNATCNELNPTLTKIDQIYCRLSFCGERIFRRFFSSKSTVLINSVCCIETVFNIHCILISEWPLFIFDKEFK